LIEKRVARFVNAAIQLKAVRASHAALASTTIPTLRAESVAKKCDAHRGVVTCSGRP